MKIVEIKEKGKTAIAETMGVRREISTVLLTEDLHLDDWVTVHVGYALDVLDLETAQEILYVLHNSGMIGS